MPYLIPDWVRTILQALRRYLMLGYYLGYDRNEYPGTANLATLRETFSYSSYWLNNPPKASSNSWPGKRKYVEDAGFGFLVLFNGRHSSELPSVSEATSKGTADAKSAVGAAEREGFPPKTVIFLDQEEGGRLIDPQRAYVHAWVDGVNATSYRAGLYCSGMPNLKDPAKTVTAKDVRENAGSRDIVYWVYNDACPPSKGCVFPKDPPSPGKSGVTFAAVWQFAQSPRRVKDDAGKDLTSTCPSHYHSNGNCYPPGFDPANPIHVDVNTARSRDPSNGRTPTNWVKPHQVGIALAAVLGVVLARRLIRARAAR